MWNTWVSNSTLPALEQSSLFAERRHQLLAGNVANIDTPGYQTRDVSLDDFHLALKEALSAGESPTMPGSSSQTVPDAMARVRDVGEQILYHDGSDVSIEEQVTEISNNQGMYNTSIALMRSQFRTLQMAIRESVAV